MGTARLLCVVLAISCTLVAADDEYSWSEYTYENHEHSLSCNGSGVFINSDDKLTWTKHNHEGEIKNNDHYQLKEVDGIKSMELHIKMVTDEMAGIYFCHVHDKNDQYVGRVVKGINVGGKLYEDLTDRYETNIITGVIAGVAVLVFIVGICLIDRFRYLTDDQKAKRREREEKRRRRKIELASTNGAYTNEGMDNGLGEHDGKKSYSPNEYTNTHL